MQRGTLESEEMRGVAKSEALLGCGLLSLEPLSFSDHLGPWNCTCGL